MDRNVKKGTLKFEAQRREDSERLIERLEEVGFAPSSPFYILSRFYVNQEGIPARSQQEKRRGKSRWVT